ncbi:superoxide dismutase [Lasiosphaeria miniovina]|uniref:superoxide dismutase n=1 Tax=Lasiosphaeria miniovina TaxID=1954250 RepID=A0AA40BFV3_9PEZI|nr:superoxide dismutase [Lasiosphaeria miniovina]KAK0733483.1 superoxide dismutase [Lasiosphaeria miniovina]
MRVPSVSLLLAAAGTQVAAGSTDYSYTTTTELVPTMTSSGAVAAATTLPTGVSHSVIQYLTDAAVVTNNPPGLAFKASLPDEAFFKPAFPAGGNVKGDIIALAAPDGSGVLFQIKFSNLPKEGGPFIYHLHVDPVPSNGNCTATLGHLDPFARGETPACDETNPASCQVGDLSGKHGSIPAGCDTWTGLYIDPYVTTLEGLGSYFGNRSFVFHYANKTRITCASFEPLDIGGGGGGGSSSTSSSLTLSPPYSTVSSAPSSSVGGNATIPLTTTLPTGPPSPIATASGSSLRVGSAGALAFAAAILFAL